MDPTTTDPATPAAAPGSDEVADLAGAEEIARQLMAEGEVDEADEAPAAAPAPTPPAAPAEPAKAEQVPVDAGLAELERIALERRARAEQARRRPGGAPTPAAPAAPATEAQKADNAADVTAELRRSLSDGDSLLDTLDRLGFSEAEIKGLYVSLRQAATNPAPRARRTGAPAPAPVLTVDAVQAAVQAALDRREAATAEAREAEGAAEAEAQHAEAQHAFASLTGDAARFPLLSDESPADRAARGVRVARRLVSEGKEATFEEIASAAEAELEQETLRRHARIAGRAGGASGQGAKTGDDVAARTGRAKPRTLSHDLASQRSAPPQSYPDGIEPEELRMRAAIEIAERGLERER